MFETELFPTTAVQQRQYVDAVGCPTYSSGLISIFVFDILQNPAGCIHICSGCICAPLAMGLRATEINMPCRQAL
jgi:hypothetical protein